MTQGSGGWWFSNLRLGFAQGAYPTQLQVQVSTGVTATKEVSFGISNSVIEAGVGYSFSTSFQITSSGTWTPPAGKSGRLEAYALYDKKSWDVWNDDCGGPDDTYVGSGASFKPNQGTYFKQVIL